MPGRYPRYHYFSGGLRAPATLSQLAVIVIAAIIGVIVCKPTKNERHEPLNFSVRPHAGAFWLALSLILLIELPVLAAIYPNHTLVMVGVFYRTGSLVFGGGHVVLPFLQSEVVPNGWVSNNTFLAVYGAEQAVPGPLFTFSAFLGASMELFPSGWEGGMLCLLAIFAPSFLLVTGALPFRDLVKENIRIRAALAVINAAVVGLLLAALYNPVWISAINEPQDFCLALLDLVSLTSWRLPPWLVVVCGGFVGGMI